MPQFYQIPGRSHKPARTRDSGSCPAPASQPLSDHRHPRLERNQSSSVTRGQFLQHLWAVEKIRDCRHRQCRQKNSTGHFSRNEEICDTEDRIRSAQRGTTYKVPAVSTVSRQEAWSGLTSHPEVSWTPSSHWKHAHQSPRTKPTDKTVSPDRREHEATTDSLAVQTSIPENQKRLPPLAALTPPCRISRLLSVTNNDQSISTQTRKLTSTFPPILLPRIYTLTPRPLQYREFMTRTQTPGPITDDVWQELKQCRYIRHAVFGGPRRANR